MNQEEREHLLQILDRWSPSIPKGLTATREGNAALFHDADGVLRMAMPWEDYEAIKKWKKEQAT